MRLREGRSADCPSTFISKHLAVSLQALQCCFGSLGDVIDSLGDLGRRHLMVANRQFAQDHFAYWPTPSPRHRLFAVRICPNIAGSNFTTSISMAARNPSCRALISLASSAFCSLSVSAAFGQFPVYPGTPGLSQVVVPSEITPVPVEIAMVKVGRNREFPSCHPRRACD